MIERYSSSSPEAAAVHRVKKHVSRKVCGLSILLLLLGVATNAWGSEETESQKLSTAHSSDTNVMTDVMAQASAPAPLPMSLDECVALAVRRNTTIRLAYMDRVLYKYNFTTASDYAFRPNVSLSTTAGRNGARSEAQLETTSGADQVSSTLSVGQRLTTGGSVSFSAKPWSRARSRSQRDDEESMTSKNIDRSWSVNLSQPLLKGAGHAYATADRRFARLGEIEDVLRLKETVMGQVTIVIKAYRALLQAKWTREINASALARARQQYQMNQVLIEMGRMPRMELIQSESDVANRELSYQLAVNGYDQARISLLKLLDLNVETLIEPVEDLALPEFRLDEDAVLKRIHAHQPSYLTTLLNVERVKISLMRARSEQHWDLNLTGSYERARSDVIPGDATKNAVWQVGLALDIPLYGSLKRGIRSSLLTAENELRKMLIQLQKTEDDLRLEVRDTLRQIRTNAQQITLAARARELSEKKLEIELEKLKAGKTTNFQLVTYQDELRNLKINELSARIAYLNALTDLDRTMGMTVNTWGIALNADQPARGATPEPVTGETKAIEDSGTPAPMTSP
ncbi:MAG TPA: TolC family protein [Candidatus Ozemobacteraceae bacterium]|nr:TolC family protein [Candidatus Ozemobacteraceae bacterium]